MFKTLLYNITSEITNDICFIPYGLNILTKNETMREISIQWSVVTNGAKNVPVFDIIPLFKQQVVKILGKPFYFMRIGPTKKIAPEGRYLLVTTKKNSYCI